MAVLQSRPSMQPPLTATTFLPLWFNKPSQRHVAEHGRPIWFLSTYRRRVDQPGAALLAKVTVGKLVSQATRQTTHSVSHTSTWSGPEKSASCNNMSLSGTDSTHTSETGTLTYSIAATRHLATGIWERWLRRQTPSWSLSNSVSCLFPHMGHRESREQFGSISHP
jgi:hypothetical protein